MKNQNNLNFIRFSLAMMVLLSHAPELIDGNRNREIISVLFRGNFSFGELAVGGFFMLSGFLICKSWCDQSDAIKFLNKRIRRIFPAFIVASLVCAFVVGPITCESVVEYFTAFNPIQFIIGVFTLQQPLIPPVFLGQPYTQVNGAMWTIPIEFSCYVAVLGIGLVRGFRPAFIVLTAVLLTLGLSKTFGYSPSKLEPLHLNLAAYFSVGCCFYIFKDRIRFNRIAIAIAVVILLIGMLSYRGHQLAFALAGSYLLFSFAFAHISILKNFGKLPDVSYGLYLYGWPIQQLIIWRFPNSNPWVVFFVSAIFSLLAGWISWHSVEKRFIMSK